MEPKGERMIIKFLIPSRGIIGLRNQLLTATAGEAIIHHRFLEFQPFKGEISRTHQRLAYFYGTRYRYPLLFRQATRQKVNSLFSQVKTSTQGK